MAARVKEEAETELRTTESEIEKSTEPVEDVGQALNGPAGMVAASVIEATVESNAGLTGRRLGVYRLGEKLGGGVISVVFQAADERTQQPVAVKMLLTGADEVMRERFRREAELVSSLEHPHIVRTLEVGETGANGDSSDSVQGHAESIAYIAMELAEGCSLAQLLERYGRLSASEAAALLAPIAEALDYAHARDIVHRDVKPSNILLRREAGNPPGSVRISALEYAVTPLLTDFGIARALDAPELTNAGRTIGTPAFMSPEQCAGEDELDGRSDVYGLGAVFYRCVVGKTPYLGSTTQMLYAHVYEALLIPEEMVVLLPPIALGALQRAMMKDPAHRYQTAAEMAQDLTVVGGRVPLSDKDAPAAATVTMPALPVVRKEGQADFARVLVPSPIFAGSSRAGPGSVRPGVGQAPGRTTVKRESVIPRIDVELASARPAFGSGHRRRLIGRALRGKWAWTWGRAAALAVAATLLIAVGIGAFSLLLLTPGGGFLAGLMGGDAVGTPTTVAFAPPAASPPATNSAATNSAATDSPAVAPPPGATPTPARAGAVSGGSDDTRDTVNAGDATPDAISPESAEPSTTPASAQTPEGADDDPQVAIDADAETIWRDVQSSVESQEWADALDLLLLLRQAEPDFEVASVQALLNAVYLELAQAAFEDGDTVASLRFLVDAAEEQADAEVYARVADAFVAYRAALEENVDALDEDALDEFVLDEFVLQEMRAALADVADELATGETEANETGRVAVCDAALIGRVAVSLGSDNSADGELASDWLGELVVACEEAQTPVVVAPSGRLVYSSQDGDRYAIHAMPLSAPGNSATLALDASQPRFRADSRIVAFHSWQSGALGLFGLDISAGQGPAARSVHYSGFVEDSRDSPPSWSPSGDHLVFSSARGDGRHRVYVTTADGNHQTQELRIGKDPAWHPWLDLIVFNGVDHAGQNPGLWVMASDGSNLRQLTDNGNDLRPAWTPDGRFIVFMSSGRDGSSELYRLDVASAAIFRLTFSESQDGLPAVSPDGVYVAYASDRAGFWEFWYVPVLGGNSIRLGAMNGQLVRWLEHGLQWIP